MAKHRDVIDIQQGGEHGRTALHLSAIHDHEECARILVSCLWDVRLELACGMNLKKGIFYLDHRV